MSRLKPPVLPSDEPVAPRTADDVAAEVLLIGRTQPDGVICKRTAGELRRALREAFLAGQLAPSLPAHGSGKPDSGEWGVLGTGKKV